MISKSRLKEVEKRLLEIEEEKPIANLVLLDAEGEKYPFKVKGFSIQQNDSLIDLEISLRQCKRIGVFTRRD